MFLSPIIGLGIVALIGVFFYLSFRLIEWQDITRRETIEGAEAAIDGSIKHFEQKLELSKGPKVVKTFK